MRVFILALLLAISFAAVSPSSGATADVSAAKATVAQELSKEQEARKKVADASTKLKEAAQEFLSGVGGVTEAIDTKNALSDKLAQAKGEEMAKKVSEAADAKDGAEKAAQAAAAAKEAKLKKAEAKLSGAKEDKAKAISDGKAAQEKADEQKKPSCQTG